MSSVRVFTYQKIGVAPKNSPFKNEWTSVSALTHTLDKIKKRGLTTLSPAQILSGNLPQKSVLLLFLDGYRSFYQIVYPLLKERGLSACVCLPTACVGTYNSWQDPHQEFWQDLLTWDEIEILSKDPLISFGAQTLNREDLTLLPNEQARYNAQESIFRLTKFLPNPPQLFAAFPSRKKLKNAAEILPSFDGIVISADGIIKPTCPAKVVRGNSWHAKWL